MEKVKDYPPYLDYPKPRKPHTNADRIRAMSDKELAEMLINVSHEVEPCNYCSPQQTFGQDCGINSVCRDGVLGWLQQPAEEG